MKKLLQFYRLANLLSVDVAAGAIVSGLFFARILRVQILPWGLAALGLTVWIIYTADHLLDARRLNAPASTERHRFHQKHFRKLVGLLGAMSAIDLVLIFLIRRPVLESGLALACIVVLYLLLQRNLKSLKELSATLLYCSGVALPALTITDYPLAIFQVILLVQFGLTVLCNLLLFSLFDHHQDILDSHNSFVTIMGKRRTRQFISLLFFINAVFAILQVILFSCPVEIILIMVVMNLILFVIFIFPRWFGEHGLYRLFGDAVFLVPLFFLLR